MLRKIFAVSLFVSFMAMATSGMMMLAIEKPSFTIQMHPVHKLFGILMIVSVFGHLSFNYRTLFNHLKTRAVSLFAAVLVVILVLLYGVSLNNPVPESIATPMDGLALEAESRER